MAAKEEGLTPLIIILSKINLKRLLKSIRRQILPQGGEIGAAVHPKMKGVEKALDVIAIRTATLMWIQQIRLMIIVTDIGQGPKGEQRVPLGKRVVENTLRITSIEVGILPAVLLATGPGKITEKPRERGENTKTNGDAHFHRSDAKVGMSSRKISNILYSEMNYSTGLRGHIIII